MVRQADDTKLASLNRTGFAKRDIRAKTLRFTTVLVCAAISISAISSPNAFAVAGKGVVTLTNGRVTLGVDPAMGGVITYLAAAGGPNLVNDHDLGREVQQSYYSGPTPYGHPTGIWAKFGWNPIGSGDNLGHKATAKAEKRGANELYVRSTPYQWALDRVRCDCRFESVIRLDGNQIHVRQRLTNMRSDLTQYPAKNQEVPAVYINTILRRIVTYTGAHPFVGAKLDRPAATWPPKQVTATEYWVALVDAKDRGIGVISPASNTVDVGVTEDRDGVETDGRTSYISPRQADILDHNIIYETDYTLVVGDLADIRAAALAFKQRNMRPDYLFKSDRQGWSYVNAQDAGWPITGQLHVVATRQDPQMIGPARGFVAADVGALYVTASFTGGREAQLYWSTADHPGFAEERSIKVAVVPDGTMGTIRIPTGSATGWNGLITKLRFDPPGTTGAHADVCAIASYPVNC